MAENRQQPRFPLFPIAEWPGKLRVGQRVPVADARLADVELEEGSLYSAWSLRAAEKLPELANYTFHETRLDGADLILVWSPPVWTTTELASMSEAARARGRLIKRYNESRQHSWPAVLKDLILEYAYYGLGQRRQYQEDVAVSCVVQVSKYVTDVTPTPDRVRCNEPIPGEVQGSFNGQNIHFPSCLHPRVEITGIPPTDAQLIDCTPDRQSESPSRTQVFEATNHEDLRPHIFMKDVVENGALYFITEYKVFPPRDIPAIYA